MDQKAAFALFLTLLVLSVGFSVATAATPDKPIYPDALQQFDSLQQLSAAVPLVVGTSLHSHSAYPLDQPTRIEIYSYIQNNPGVHFRGACDGLDLSVGVVQYHLGVLEKEGYVTAYVDGANKRYFEADAFTPSEMQLISLARHPTTREILALLSQNGALLHRDLALCVGITSQALTWQMDKLDEAGLIHAAKTGVNVKYILNNPDTVRNILNLIEHQ